MDIATLIGLFVAFGLIVMGMGAFVELPRTPPVRVAGSSRARVPIRCWTCCARGIPDKRLSVVGYGPSHPRHDNVSRVGRARNRRVEIVIKGRIESP